MIEVRKPHPTPEALRIRTKAFAFDVLRLIPDLPPRMEARIISRQLARSSMSVAANYRASCRSRSRAEFIAKIGIVLEEADESLFWLEALSELGISRDDRLGPLIGECNELVAIFFVSQRTARRRAPNHQSSIINHQ